MVSNPFLFTIPIELARFAFVCATRTLIRFARDFSGFVNESGKKGSQRVTGVGRSVEVDTMILPELKLRVRGPEVVLRPATVLLKDTVSDLSRCHVWIGMDLLTQHAR